MQHFRSIAPLPLTWRYLPQLHVRQSLHENEAVCAPPDPHGTANPCPHPPASQVAGLSRKVHCALGLLDFAVSFSSDWICNSSRCVCKWRRRVLRRVSSLAIFRQYWINSLERFIDLLPGFRASDDDFPTVMAERSQLRTEVQPGST